MLTSALLLLAPLTMAQADVEMELMLVHGVREQNKQQLKMTIEKLELKVWRHGDRSPTRTFPTDPIQEDSWTFGGGGFGQLSPLGMARHMNFGKLLRRLYVDTGFLSKRYKSNEIYIRSTDVNRTIISAMSNLLGMYGQNNSFNEPAVDYPVADGWPPGYVPIAIHSEDFQTDYIGNPEAECDRQRLLWNMAKSSAELEAFQNRTDVAELFRKLTIDSGEKIDIDNLWVIYDSLLIEQIHMNETLREKNKWFTDDLFKQITEVNNQITLYYNGKFNKFSNKTLIMNNLDIGLEIQKIRGGSLFNEINSRMNMKFDCMNRVNNAKCSWINTLKYYIYSAHDTTVYAFLSILDIEEEVLHPEGFPEYSAAVFIELYLNRTDYEPYFKLLYHKNGLNDTLYPITHYIGDCNGMVYCKMDVFRKYATRTKPDAPMNLNDLMTYMDLIYGPIAQGTSSGYVITNLYDI